jgi:hypothetical protein
VDDHHSGCCFWNFWHAQKTFQKHSQGQVSGRCSRYYALASSGGADYILYTVYNARLSLARKKMLNLQGLAFFLLFLNLHFKILLVIKN